MHRCNRDAGLAQRIEFAAEQRSAGVEGETGSVLVLPSSCLMMSCLRMSRQTIGQHRRCALNRAVGDAEPEQGGIQRGGICGDWSRSHLGGERPRAPTRPGQIARYDLGDWETSVAQRYGQKRCQTPGSNDGYGGLSGRWAFGRSSSGILISAHRRSIAGLRCKVSGLRKNRGLEFPET